MFSRALCKVSVIASENNQSGDLTHLNIPMIHGLRLYGRCASAVMGTTSAAEASEANKALKLEAK